MSESHIRYRSRWIIWYAIALHLIWALALLTDPQAGSATAVSGTVSFWIGSAVLAAFSYIVASALSVVSLVRDQHDMKNLLLVLPQQALLMMSATSAYQAMLAGHFADGVARPFWFLVADQSPAVIVATLHTCSILEPYLRALAHDFINSRLRRNLPEEPR